MHDSDQTQKATAVSFAWLLVLSTVAVGVGPLAGLGAAANTSGNVAAEASVSDVSDPPGVYAPNATIDGSTDAQIEVAYDVEGEISLEDLALSGGFEVGPDEYGFSADSQRSHNVNETLTSTADVRRFEIPSGTLAGGTYVAGTNAGSSDAGFHDFSLVNVSSTAAVTDYSVNESDLFVGEGIEVTATIENTGSESVDYHVPVYVNDNYDWDPAFDERHYERGKTVTVAAGATEKVTFTTSFTDDGQKEVGVGTADRTVVDVTDPLQMTNLSTSPDTVTPGEDVTVAATYENPSSESIDVTRHAYVDGGPKSVPLDVSIDAESEGTATNTTSFATSGTHAVSLNGQTSFVRVDGPVSVTDFNLSSYNVTTGESVTVNATLANDGSASADASLVFANEHHVLEQRTLTVPAGGTTVSFTHTFDREQRTDVTVNGLDSRTVEVNSPIETAGYSVSDRKLSPGETLTVDVTYENPTSQDREYDPDVYLGGSSSWFDSVTVPADSQRTVSFSTTYDEVGTKHLFVEDAHDSVVVTDGNTDDGNVTVRNVYEPTMEAGERGFVGVELENVGSGSGVETVALSHDGSTLGTASVYLNAGERDFAVIPVSFASTGTRAATLTAGSGSSATDYDVTIDVRDPVVVSSSVEHVDGTAPDGTPDLDASLSSSGMVSATLQSPEGGLDLDQIGADETTRFRIDLVLENYDPRVVMSTGRDLQWTRENLSDGRTRVSATATAAELNFRENPPRIENWDAVSNDTADFGTDASVMLGVSDGNNSFFRNDDPAALDGMTISTNAQRFRPPRYVPPNDGGPRVSVKLAGPHYTTGGELNEGYYEAFLPNSLLGDWGVDDPSELMASYTAADDTRYTVTEVDGGMRVNVSLHYSAGTLRIEPSDDESSSGGRSGTPDVAVTDAAIATERVDPGEEVAVDATVANDGSAFGSEVVALRIDGETVSEVGVGVDDGAVEATTLRHTFYGAGTYNVTVNGVVAGTVTVGSPATETPTDAATATESATPSPTDTATATETADAGTATPAATESGDSQPTRTTTANGPGFGVVTALAALLATALAVRRRR